MALRRILKIARTDSESSCALIHVSSNGSKPLDLKLVSTEGDGAYVYSLRHDRVASLRVNNCPVSESEWQSILTSVLEPQPLPNIEVAAAVHDESTMVLTIRKQVQGITQRLGSITLHNDAVEREKINLFDWCVTLAEAAALDKESADRTSAELQDVRAALAELRSQLDELVAAKAEDENALLHKFRDLLNEKKVKIRQQQKIIAELSPDKAAAEDPQSSKGQTGAKPSPKKAPKRKVRDEESESSEPDLATKIKSEPDSSEAGDRTEATASEASVDEDMDEAEDEALAKGDVLEPQLSRNAKAATPPPPRRLPFQRGRQSPTLDVSSSDDEL